AILVSTVPILVPLSNSYAPRKRGAFRGGKKMFDYNEYANEIANESIKWSVARNVFTENLDQWDAYSVYRFAENANDTEHLIIHNANRLIDLRELYGWEGF